MVFFLTPLDTFRAAGTPAFAAGPELFFLAGLIIVLGGVWAVMFNADVLLGGLLLVFGRRGRLAPVLRMAVSYPLQNRFRTGMTVAAQQALALRRLLARTPQPAPRHYFRLIAKTIDPPWDIAVGADLAFPDVPGTRTAKTRLVNTYLPGAAYFSFNGDQWVGTGLSDIAFDIDQFTNHASQTQLMLVQILRRAVCLGQSRRQ